MAASKLVDGMKYHYSILYNHYEGPPSGRHGDHLLSWNFLTEMKGKLTDKGYVKALYHDNAVAGSNIFKNLFEMVNKSEKVFVLLTPSFLDKGKKLENGWHQYCQQAAIKNLIDKKETERFIPIAINVAKEDIPEDFGLSTSTIIYVDYKNNKVADESVWGKIDSAMGHIEKNLVKISVKKIKHD